MQNVTALQDPVKANIETVISWAVSMGDRGEYAATTVRNETTALRQFATVLQPDEAQDPRSLLAAIDDLHRRWATKNPSKKSSTTYKGRAQQLLEDYLRWCEAPEKFQGRQAKPRPKRSGAKASTAARSEAEATTEADAPSPEERLKGSYDIPGTRRRFRFDLDRDFHVGDLPAMFYHLATLAKDFNPAELGWLMGIQRREQPDASKAVVPRDNGQD